jgi:very-short-patch-repair endonuclease
MSKRSNDWSGFAALAKKTQAPAKTKTEKKAPRRSTKTFDMYPLFKQVLELTTKEEWVEEYAFTDKRKWRLDVACVRLKIAIEVEGGGRDGRHTRHFGFLADMEKYNNLVVEGWHLIRCTPAQVDKPGILTDLLLKLISRLNDEHQKIKP